MINLIIDNRERELIEQLRIMSVKFTLRNLDIGDVLFTDANNNTLLLIERKTVMDLKASICDGRAREQKTRMMNCGIDISRIIYLIEGNLNKSLESKISRISVSILLGSIINSQLRDNIKVYKTSAIHETACYICKLLEKLNKDVDCFFKSNQREIDDVKYSCVLNKKKKENVTPSVWFISQLSLIPQISEKIASEITKKYPSVTSLVLDYEKQEENDRPNMLSNIEIYLNNGNTRKLGNKLSEKIYKMFYSKT